MTSQPEKSAAESCSRSIPLLQPCDECTEKDTATTRTAAYIPVLLRYMGRLSGLCVAVETLRDGMNLIARLATQVLNLRSRLSTATERAEKAERERAEVYEELGRVDGEMRRQILGLRDTLTTSRAAHDKLSEWVRYFCESFEANADRWSIAAWKQKVRGLYEMLPPKETT